VTAWWSGMGAKEDAIDDDAEEMVDGEEAGEECIMDMLTLALYHVR
jgi:hypothetical protein